MREIEVLLVEVVAKLGAEREIKRKLQGELRKLKKMNAKTSVVQDKLDSTNAQIQRLLKQRKLLAVQLRQSRASDESSRIKRPKSVYG